MIQVLIALLMLMGNQTICDQGERMLREPSQEEFSAAILVQDDFELYVFESGFILLGYNEEGEKGLVCARSLEEQTPVPTDVY